MPELRSRRFLLSAALFTVFTFQPIAAGSAAATTAPIGSSAAPASLATAAVEGELAGQLADALRRARYNNIAPGMAMSVIGPDGQTWSGSSGWFPEGVPVKADSPMRIGSVTKTFTAAIILGLVDEGRIELDVPASTYLPQVRLVRGATVRQLLSHTSGIADLYGPMRPWLEGDPGAHLSSNAVLGEIGHRYFAPGHGYAYSNTNFYLLGMIIQVVTGHSFEEELNQRFLVPLGLEHTHLVGRDDPELPVAWSSAFWSSGAMVASMPDLARWGRALYAGGAISYVSKQRMRDFDFGVHYGLGCQQLHLGNRWVPGHSGLLYDTTTLLVHLRPENITIAISAPAPYTDFEAALVEHYDDGPSLMDLIARLGR